MSADGEESSTFAAKVTEYSFKNEITIRRLEDEKPTVVSSEVGEELESLGLAETILKRRPRVELFTPVEQLMDVVTIAELEQPNQEFMQGIFRYAEIWDDRKQLFVQTATNIS